MLLQSLIAADRAAGNRDDDPSNAGAYQVRPVRWALDLDHCGQPTTTELLDLADPEVPDHRRGQPMWVPDVARTSGIAPIVATDSLEYVLGVPRDNNPKNQADAKRRHDAFAALHEELATRSENGPLRTFHQFLIGTRPVTVPGTATSSDRVAVRVDGRWVHEDHQVRALWREELHRRKATGRIGRCLVCGAVATLAATFPTQLRMGSVPGQQQQLAVVSVNTAAQGRNGEIGLTNTPVCLDCATRSIAALNRLLADPAAHRRMGDDRVLAWWTDQSQPFDPFSLTPTVRTAFAAALDALDSYRRAHTDLDTTRFRAIVAGANASRLVIHRWLDRTLNETLDAVAAWFDDHTINGPGDGPQVFPIWHLAVATGQWDPKQKRYRRPEHGAEAALTICALDHSAPPLALLAATCARIRADGHLANDRGALLRLVLRRHHLAPPEVTMPELNPDAASPAYQCGRLLAIADGLQRQAIPGLNTSVADKVLGRCSMAPGTVLPKVLTDAQAHLKKLRTSGRTGAAVAIQRRLDETAADLRTIPTTLTIAEQGQFLLGFLHQRNADTAAARAAIARTTTDQETDDA